MIGSQVPLKDMAKVKEADIFVYNGIVEGWVDKALESASNDKRVVVEASKGIDLMEGVPGKKRKKEVSMQRRKDIF